MDDVNEFLSGIRKTIAESERLVESTRLRIAETDRLLASSGLTRDQVISLEFTAEQRLRVNEELRRLGLPAIEEDAAAGDFAAASDRLFEEASEPSSGDIVAERGLRFGNLMHEFRL